MMLVEWLKAVMDMQHSGNAFHEQDLVPAGSRIRRCGRIWMAAEQSEDRAFAFAMVGFAGLCFCLIDTVDHMSGINLDSIGRRNNFAESYRGCLAF